MNRGNEQSGMEYFPETSPAREMPDIYRAKNSKEIEREIQFTLLQMRETLGSIEDQLSPRAVKGRIMEYLSKPSVKVLAGIGLFAVARRKPFLSAVAGIGGVMYALNRMRTRYEAKEPEILHALEEQRKILEERHSFELKSDKEHKNKGGGQFYG